MIDLNKPYPPEFLSEKIMREYKREAKAVSKQDSCTLTEAYEKLARLEGFPNWHKVTLQRKRDSEVESFFLNRAVAVFNAKDAPSDVELQSGFFTPDYALPLAADRPFIYAYINRHHLFGSYTHPPVSWSDETDDNLDEAITAGELMMDLEWFRINQDLKQDDTPMDVLKRIKPHTFFPPDYISIKGIFYAVRDERGMFAW